MKKNDLKKFIELKREQALRKVSNKYSELIQKYKEKKVDELLEVWHPTFTEGINLYKAWQEKTPVAGCVLSGYRYSTISYMIDGLDTVKNGSQEQKRNLIIDAIDWSEDSTITRYKNKRDKERTKIKEEFLKVFANLQHMNGKEGTKWVHTLGFEIPTKEIRNEVLAPIDIKFIKEVTK